MDIALLVQIGQLIAMFFASIFVLLMVAIVVRKISEGKLYSDLEYSVFAVKMPRFERKEDKPQDFRQLIGAMEQVYSNFLYLKEKNFGKVFVGDLPRISIEVASEIGGSDIVFYVSVPKAFEFAVEKSIQGVYPGAVIDRIAQDYTIFEPGCQVSSAFLQQEQSFFHPISTYTTLQSDPISVITNSLSKIREKEGAAIQIILQPLDFDMRRKGASYVANLARGFTGGIKVGGSASASEAFMRGLRNEPMFTPQMPMPGQPMTPGGHPQPSPYMNPMQNPAMNPNFFREPDQMLLEAVKKKMQKPALFANIRLLASSDSQNRSDFILQDLKSAFTQFSSPYNAFKFRDISDSNENKAVYDYSFRVFRKSQAMILNTEELASLMHFPSSSILSPNIKWAKTREVEPPSTLPDSGDISIGLTSFRGDKKEVYFSNEDDRRRHFYIVGQTGTGKSSLLFEMIRQDIMAGKGVGLIDPHGDLADDVLSIIPRERVDDIVLFEPSDMERPVGLNMLEWETPEQKDFVVSEMIMIFTKLFPPEIIGPMFEHYMRNAMLALIADKDNLGTLVEIPRIFTDEDYMESRLAMVTDPLVRSFWLREWKQTVGQTKSDMLGYVVSKVGRFVENEMMRNIIGQQNSGFDLRDVMDNKKIFIANLSKGKTGEMNSSLLGLILVSKMQVAAMQRGNMPLESRKDFYLYIDEFHNFTTDNIATILSEARKYRLNLILAHQYMPQLQEPIKNAVMGNAGSIASFRIGVQDAEFLEKQFEPGFTRQDLVNLDNFNFIIRMMVNNNVTSAFKVMTKKPQKGNLAIVEPIKKISKLKYGRAKEIVEAEIAQRWNF